MYILELNWIIWPAVKHPWIPDKLQGEGNTN